jgi:hypothetical protein
MRKPLAIDLFCGLGGWTEGLLAEGYDVVGFDIERHVYGDQKYPAQLVLQDVLTLHGSQFKTAALIVASPPCQAYSYRAMPWKKAKALPPPDNSLFEACFRIAGEAGVPLVVENVKGAQKWVGRAKAHYGSFYLWGDVESVGSSIIAGEFRFGQALKKGQAVKVPGMNWSGSDKPGYVAQAFNGTAVKNHAHGGGWFHENRDHPLRATSSGSLARRMASANVAKIPFPLSSYIARSFRHRKFIS